MQTTAASPVINYLLGAGVYLSLLSALFDQQTGGNVSKIVPSSSSNLADELVNGQLSVKSFYLQDQSARFLIGNKPFWEGLWSLKIRN